MKRTPISSVLITLLLAGFSLPGYAFDFFGLFSKNDLEDMLPYVPADTPVFFAGTVDEQLAEQLNDMTDPAMLADAGTSVEQLFAEAPQTPGFELLENIVLDFYSDSDKSLSEKYARYGYKQDGASVVYFDGLFPVFRMALEDEDALWATIQQQADDAGYELTERTLRGSNLKTFPLIGEDDKKLTLGLLTTDDILTISLLTSKDTDAALAQRFALVEPAESVAEKEWDALGDDYELDDQLRGYIHLVRLAQMFLDDNSRAMQQLSILSDDELPMAAWPQSCRSETVGLLEGAPRIVFGTQDMDVDGELLTLDILSALEINNGDVLSDLTALSGFVPGYITDNKQVSMGVAFGLDVNRLVPTLTSLWSRFLQLEFACEPLQALQAQVEPLNPAVLSMVAGFGQGVKGISVGLFDLDVSAALDQLNADMLVTISAEDPSVIASLLTSYVPFLQGQSIPKDGTPIEMALPMPTVQPKLAIKNQHLVLFTGEQAEAEANKLSSVELTNNGIGALALDYQKLGELMTDSVQAFSAFQSQTGDDTDCTELYVGGLALKQLDFRLTGRDSFSDKGLISRYNIEMNPSAFQSVSGDITGKYQIDMMDYDCSWSYIGQEDLNSDGTGMFTQMDDAGSCNLFESRYQWNKTMNVMEQTDAVNRYRDECSEAWSDDESYDFSCTILATDDSGFYCLETNEGDMTLYRYSER